MGIKFKDENQIPEVIRNLETLNSKHLKIGITGKADSSIQMIAVVNEFGATIKVTDKMRGFLSYNFGVHLKKGTTTIKIPERSFIRAGYDGNRDDILKAAEKGLTALLNTTVSSDKYIEVLGEYVLSKINAHFRSITTPKNSDLTISQKGSNKPLVNTGRLAQSITFEVVG